MNRQFDTILYDVGDEVIAKHKSPDSNGVVPGKETVCNTQMVDSGTGYDYQIIYFISNPSSPNVAFQYEPYDEVVRKSYHAELAKARSNKSKTTKKTSTPPKDNIMDTLTKNVFNHKLK